ncbi:ABC transporter substrate-binding protein [Peribacillus asahii]|uniref:ABC transporter substrate-binding protein n=1 Tax=Peribacillus asahii TaxID=228899 RepID=A0A3T0KUZ2_9BACI|nr:ABC transporter substrate-binding protein [Peribacillus asahii]AZV44232.1 ABC transporter substrate-binding protein [Peribacillus asahii]USK83944.1 ABC transporter substrate-binding protein [Peribacillus asahii]
MKKKLYSAAAITLVTSALLAGCGSDSSSEDTKKEDNGEKTYQVGVTQIVQHASLDEATKGFQDALKESDLNVEFDVQNAQNDQSNNQTIAKNLVSDKVDLIFANSTPSALGAKNATSDIPIVFTSVTDPIEAELVTSLEKPGANVTGTTDSHPDAIANTVKFIAEELGAKTIGTVYNAGEKNSIVQVENMKAEAKKLGVKVSEASVSTSADVKKAAESLIGKVDAFYIVTDNTVVSALESVVGVSNDKDIPLFVGELDSVERGGFAAYGFSYYDIGFEAGEKAVEILKDGKKPGDIPVSYPQNLKLVINETAAKEMGVEIKDEWKKEAELVK